jgi:hypothetical protein
MDPPHLAIDQQTLALDIGLKHAIGFGRTQFPLATMFVPNAASKLLRFATHITVGHARLLSLQQQKREGINPSLLGRHRNSTSI